ncbi:hypothetical protein CYMTET_7461 [Cymbomonas tetramitiformis]|uniref:Uncharacterized protein n=1 Tax=Cymbomonas tetramitiformis TaxID=36881 RepID=A0AAE0LGV1_9CHLO|nr:hypothetical protein CYMTET_7461 [Cymbomonas tetramitiformis]
MDAPPTVSVVCTASAYAKAAGNLREICVRKAQSHHAKHEVEDVQVDMLLIDDTKENTVLMLSENMCNIGKEFADLHSIHTVSADNVSSKLCAALSAGYMMGKNDKFKDNVKRIVLVMVTDEVEGVRGLVDEVSTVCTNENSFCEVCEINFDDTNRQNMLHILD